MGAEWFLIQTVPKLLLSEALKSAFNVVFNIKVTVLI